ncbi:Hypothetical predicted protein [Lecanosticta acicola]|uniref:Uncharacterized protein n=1 Tax=Lecanosticta acicola TaxID=111012 RepID=A0AAI8YVM6_9PEZI|nr:Hypothetical predicted protein [Lecanosticta acicola]
MSREAYLPPSSAARAATSQARVHSPSARFYARRASYRPVSPQLPREEADNTTEVLMRRIPTLSSTISLASEPHTFRYQPSSVKLPQEARFEGQNIVHFQVSGKHGTFDHCCFHLAVVPPSSKIINCTIDQTEGQQFCSQTSRPREDEMHLFGLGIFDTRIIGASRISNSTMHGGEITNTSTRTVVCNVTLNKVNLRGANVTACNLEDCTLTYCEVVNSKVTTSKITSCDMETCTLEKCTAKYEPSRYDGSQYLTKPTSINNCHTTDSELNNVSVEGGTIERSHFYLTCTVKRSDFNDCRFHGVMRTKDCTSGMRDTQYLIHYAGNRYLDDFVRLGWQQVSSLALI